MLPKSQDAVDLSDPEQLKKAQDAASLRDDRRRAIERALLANPEGREWVWQILSDCHVWEKRIGMTGGPAENGFYEGQREIGLQLMRRLAASAPADFARMFVENDR